MAKKPVKPVKPVKPFETRYLVLMNDVGLVIEKLEFHTEAELEKFADDYGQDFDLCSKEEFDKAEIFVEQSNELTLGETPKIPFDETNLPEILNVVNKKSQKPFTVTRKHFLNNRNELEIV